MLLKDTVQTSTQHELKEEDVKWFLSFVLQKKRVDLSSYRLRFIMRRLSSRMNATHTNNYQDYIHLLIRDHDEFNRFLDTLSINVSKFFRDREVFDAFRKVALTDVIQRKKKTNQRTIRAWSAGCAYGEEAYSLAILIKEELKALGEDFMVKIWATDVDSDALQKAKIAEYETNSLREVSKQQLEDCFIPLDNGTYRLKEELKQMVTFAKHNLISDPPLKFMDIIFCRNVLIYIRRQEQETLFKRFNQVLNPKGYLVIGKVEILWDYLRSAFTAVDVSERIYQKQEPK
jgi:chemotaxis methyl-accepting protein methylase